jgi:hypothetical protein
MEGFSYQNYDVKAKECLLSRSLLCDGDDLC